MNTSKPISPSVSDADRETARRCIERGILDPDLMPKVVQGFMQALATARQEEREACAVWHDLQAHAHNSARSGIAKAQHEVYAAALRARAEQPLEGGSLVPSDDMRDAFEIDSKKNGHDLSSAHYSPVLNWYENGPAGLQEEWESWQAACLYQAERDAEMADSEARLCKAYGKEDELDEDEAALPLHISWVDRERMARGIAGMIRANGSVIAPPAKGGEEI